MLHFADDMVSDLSQDYIVSNLIRTLKTSYFRRMTSAVGGIYKYTSNFHFNAIAQSIFW